MKTPSSSPESQSVTSRRTAYPTVFVGTLAVVTSIATIGVLRSGLIDGGSEDPTASTTFYAQAIGEQDLITDGRAVDYLEIQLCVAGDEQKPTLVTDATRAIDPNLAWTSKVGEDDAFVELNDGTFMNCRNSLPLPTDMGIDHIAENSVLEVSYTRASRLVLREVVNVADVRTT